MKSYVHEQGSPFYVLNLLMLLSNKQVPFNAHLAKSLPTVMLMMLKIPGYLRLRCLLPAKTPNDEKCHAKNVPAFDAESNGADALLCAFNVGC